MMISSWRYAFASVEGTGHRLTQTGCQDVSHMHLFNSSHEHEHLLSVAADGAGSARHSKLGAEMVCDCFSSFCTIYLREHGTLENLSQADIQNWVDKVQQKLNLQAEQMGVKVRELACTLVACIIGPRYSCYLQLGDGAIVVGRQGIYELIFWPQTGEYVNETCFITADDAREQLMFCLDEKPLCEVAVMTDGLQHLALNYQNRQPHTPFFAPMFQRLSQADDGLSQELSQGLADFLDTERVNQRTNDDKTLILASRREAFSLQAEPELSEDVTISTTSLQKD